MNQPQVPEYGQPRQEPEVPMYPFPEDTQSQQGEGDWFGPVMIGVAILVALAVGFAMVLAVFPDLFGGDDEATEIADALEADHSDTDWYEIVVDVEVDGDQVVVVTTAEDDTAEGLDSLCEAVYGAAGDVVDEPTVSIESESGEEILECSEEGPGEDSGEGSGDGSGDGSGEGSGSN